MDDERTASEQSDEAPDRVLMARLAELFRRADPPPAEAVELARGSFGLRTVDADLAALVADSHVDRAALTVRDGEPATGPRLLTFEAAGLAVEIEVSRDGRQRRLLGQLIPAGPARIEVQQAAAERAPAGTAPDPRFLDADDRGRFVVESVDPGPVRLTCHRSGRRPVTTAWTSVD